VKVVVRYQAILGISGHIENLKSREEKAARERKMRLRENTIGECSDKITTYYKYVIFYTLLIYC
jgi:hypothetical protein